MLTASNPVRRSNFSHAHTLLQTIIDGQGVALDATSLIYQPVSG